MAGQLLFFFLACGNVTACCRLEFFFKYGKFSYGIDLGCLWKSTLLLLLTTLALGTPNYYNTRFIAEHGQEGDVITIDTENLSYNYRKGTDKTFSIKDIVRIYREPVTFNPPPRFFVVAETGGTRDSIFVTKNLPNYEKMLSRLSELSNVPFEQQAVDDSWKQKDNSFSALYYLQYEYIKPRLKAPRTAKFPSLHSDGTEVKKDGLIYEIVSYVDSQNSFGAMLRKYYIAKVTQGGENLWRVDSFSWVE